MAVNLSPAAGAAAQFFDNNGVILAGGLLYTYAAGTTTPQAAYTSSTGGTAWSNPIVLNSAGRLSGGGEIWLTAGAAYKFVLYDANSVLIATYDQISGVNDSTSVLAFLAGATGSNLVGYTQGGSGAVATTVQTKLRQTVSVLDFGVNTTPGVTNMTGAFIDAWAAIKETGGELLIPPGNYLLSSTWTCTVSSTLPYNYKISGYGATLFATAAVTGYAMSVVNSYNNFGVAIEGLQFNHRNNTTVQGCISAIGAANLRITKCSMEAHNTKAGYKTIYLNGSSYWTLIDGFTTRQRTGGDGTDADYGVVLDGQANATHITNCSFTSVYTAIQLQSDGVTSGNPNGCVIDCNNFEGVTNAILINLNAPTTTMPVGLRILNNRVESTTTFLYIQGGAVLNGSYPPIVQNNYCTVGSVTNYLVNPNSQYIFSNESSYYGSGLNYMGGPTDYKIIAESTGKNVIISNLSNTSNYNSGHLKLGSHLWLDSTTQRFFTKDNGVAPTSGQDGTMVGSINGTSTFAAATTLVVTFGYTMPSAVYRVALGASANKTFWVTSKTTTTFTLNASSASSDTVDWVLTV